MRRNVLIGVALVVLLAGIGLGAYNVGLSRGVAQQLESSGRLVPIDGPGFGRGYGVVVSEGTAADLHINAPPTHPRRAGAKPR